MQVQEDHPNKGHSSPLQGGFWYEIGFLIAQWADLGVSKNRGKNPKMDGENNGKPY